MEGLKMMESAKGQCFEALAPIIEVMFLRSELKQKKTCPKEKSEKFYRKSS